VGQHAVFYYSQDLVPNEYYTLSFKVKKNSGASVYGYSLYLRTKDDGFINIVENTEDNTDGFYYGSICITDEILNSLKKEIWIGVNGVAGSGTVSFENIKLEKGSTATEWCAADEDNVSAISTNNNFSWNFSPSSGFYMYNGDPNTAETKMVFGVYNMGTSDKPSY
jgi:hypothetical protein